MPFASNRGVRLHYEVFGEGPPLFLHVGVGGEWDLWKLAGYLDRLKGFQLIINDPRGWGSSDRPKTMLAYRMENFVQDAVTILDDLKIPKCFFWGHSDGALVATAFARAHSNRLNALILAAGTAEPGETGQAYRVDFAKDVRKNGLGFLNKFFEKSYGRKLPSWYAKGRSRKDPQVFAFQMLAWIPWVKEAWNFYPRIKVPTLLMSGDVEDPTGLSKKVAKAMPDARAVVLKALRPGSSDIMLNHVDGLMRSDISTRYAKRFLHKHLT